MLICQNTEGTERFFYDYCLEVMKPPMQPYYAVSNECSARLIVLSIQLMKCFQNFHSWIDNCFQVLTAQAITGKIWLLHQRMDFRNVVTIKSINHSVSTTSFIIEFEARDLQGHFELRSGENAFGIDNWKKTLRN